jgi:hypothetical protein
MLQPSSKFEVRAEGLSVLEHGPEDVDAAPRQGDNGLVVALSLASLALVEGAAVGMGQGAEGGLVEEPLQGLVAAGRPAKEAGLAGLAQEGGDAGRGGQRVGGGEAGEVACLGDELGGEYDPALS